MRKTIISLRLRRRPIARAWSKCSDERRSAMVACRMYGLLFVLFSGLALGAPWASVAAEAEAQKNNWPVVITVVDTGEYVVAVHRLDNTQLGSIAVAEDKARTAVLFRRPSKGFEDAIAGGGIGLRVLGLRGATPYA